MMEVTLTKISDHARNGRGSTMENGQTMNVKQIGWSEWTLVWGEGSERKSQTLHCDERTAEYEKSLLKG